MGYRIAALFYCQEGILPLIGENSGIWGVGSRYARVRFLKAGKRPGAQYHEPWSLGEKRYR